MYFREDQADITLKVGSRVFAGSWKTFAGGDLTGDNQKTRPGGMGDEIDIGGPATRGDVTLERQMTDVVAGWIGTLEDSVGIDPALVTVKLLTPAKAASGQKLSFSGTLKAVNPPDLGGGNAQSMLTIVVSCNEKSPAGG